MLEKLNKKTIKLKLTRETLENNRRFFDLKGEGTKESPIIFDVFGDLCVEISIKMKETYLVLKNLTISRLLIINSQNLVIENCFVGNLKTVRCRNLTFKNNSLLKTRQLLSRSVFSRIVALQLINPI